MKVKSSVVLELALQVIQQGQQHYACAAIQDVETTMRMEQGENVTSNAQKIFNSFMPKRVNLAIKLYGEWWPKGSEERITALEAAIKQAITKQD